MTTPPAGLAYVHQAGPSLRHFNRGSFRRPRTCPCRYRPRSNPICKVDDDRQWFSVKPWFAREEEKKNDPVSNQSDEARNLHEANGKDREDGNGKSPIGKEEQGKPGQRSFRWPWQKDDDEKEDEPVITARRVSHSDSKPGSFGRRRADEEKLAPEPDKISLQERWRKVVDVIAPGFAKDTEKNSEKQATENDEDPNLNKAQRWVKANDGTLEKEETEADLPEPESKRKSSVSELYQPPSPEKSSNERESWFRLPWKKDIVEQSEDDQDDDERSVEKSKADEKAAVEVNETEEEGKEEDIRISSPKREVESKVVEAESQRSEGEVEATNKKRVEQKKRETAVALRSGKTSSPSPRGPFLDIVPVPQRDVAAIRLIFGSETFFATETLSAPGGLIFRGNLRGEPKATVAKLEQQLTSRLGDKYTLCLAEGDEDLRPVVVVVPTARDKRPASPRQKFMALVLALMTVSTCLGRGLLAIILKPTIHALHGPPLRDRFLYPLFGTTSRASVVIAASIGLIIIVSQIIQRLVGSRYKTRVAIPFLLPSYQLGSFGAVVQIASPTPTRAALFDIALSGAATLVLLSMTCLLVGLRMSTSFSDVIPVPMSIVSNSVVMGFLTQQVPDGKILIDYGRSLIGLHPLAVIGANCLTISALNLLPIRQLDGGRIISALYGRRTAIHASRVTVLFLLLASSKSPFFIVFLAAITFGPWHPDRPSRNELSEPDGMRTIVGYLFMLLMIGVLLPFPASKFFGTL